MAINKLDTGAIQDNAITNAKMADDAVGVADLAATGTPSSTTFLRGDNAWVTPTDTNTTYSVQDGELSQINFTSADNTKLDGIATSANNYVHPNHSGDVVSAADGAMTIQTDAVDIAMLSATGTAGSTTFLRGDNSWATAGSTSASDLTSGTLPDARFPSTLPAISGSALTNVPSDVVISATAPSSPSAGDLWFNSSAATVSNVESLCVASYSGSIWYQMSTSPPAITATGGNNISTIAGYKYHTFTSSGNFVVSSIIGTPPNLEVLMVAGGGGGGGYVGGGGGAGGMIVTTGITPTAQTYTIVVGAGGASNANGGNTTMTGRTTCIGGGIGGRHPSVAGTSGGSGGGSESHSGTVAGGAGTSGQGNAGGSGDYLATNNHATGGGGGKGAAGGNGSSSAGTSGHGGIGSQLSWATMFALTGSGDSTTGLYFAAGGGGGYYDTGNDVKAGNGGTGGGGGGHAYGNSLDDNGSGGTGGLNVGGVSDQNNNPQNVTAGSGGANTGSGGGGVGHADTGGTGGSGIVVVRYTV